MKYFILYAYLFSSFFILKSQSNLNQVNIGLLQYELTEENISQSEYEKILNTFAAFGDKQIILDQVLNSIIISSKENTIDSLINYSLNLINENDQKKLLALPAIGEHYLDRVYHIILYSYFGKAFIEKTTIIESNTKIQALKSMHFPNMPDFGVDENLVSILENGIVLSNWYLEYPNEYLFYQDLLQNQAYSVLNDSTENGVIKFCKLLKKSVIDSNTIYTYYLPKSINTLLQEREKEEEITYRYADYCNEKDLNKFLLLAYKLIFKKTPNEELILEMEKHIRDNSLIQPDLIYLALVKAKYE